MVINEDALTIVIRVAALKMRLADLYSPQQAHRWIHDPQPLLNGQRPIDMVGDTLGYLEVDNLVDYMLDCVYL